MKGFMNVESGRILSLVSKLHTYNSNNKYFHVNSPSVVVCSGMLSAVVKIQSSHRQEGREQVLTPTTNTLQRCLITFINKAQRRKPKSIVLIHIKTLHFDHILRTRRNGRKFTQNCILPLYFCIGDIIRE